jgi:hypothetical protein
VFEAHLTDNRLLGGARLSKLFTLADNYFGNRIFSSRSSTSHSRISLDRSRFGRGTGSNCSTDRRTERRNGLSIFGLMGLFCRETAPTVRSADGGNWSSHPFMVPVAGCQRFLIVKRDDVMFVANWSQDLQRLAPTAKKCIGLNRARVCAAVS